MAFDFTVTNMYYLFSTVASYFFHSNGIHTLTKQITSKGNFFLFSWVVTKFGTQQAVALRLALALYVSGIYLNVQVALYLSDSIRATTRESLTSLQQRCKQPYIFVD